MTEVTPAPLSAEVSRRMSRTPGRDTRPERLLRSELHRRGLRFRIDRAPLGALRRRADIVFARPRVAVFVDGCFWHACPLHGTQPKHNAEWWRAKLERNRARDRDTDAALVAADWRVVRAWEHEDPADVADRVEVLVRGHEGE